MGGKDQDIPLNGGTDGAVDDKLGKDTNGAGDTEENSVVVGLGETVVLEEDTGVGIDVGVGVLGLAVLGQDTGSNLVDLANQLEHGVLGHFRCRERSPLAIYHSLLPGRAQRNKLTESKGALGAVAGVGLAEDGVAVAGDDTAGVEGVPEVLLDVLVAEVVTDDLLHLGEPVEDFLVGQTVEGTSETVETGRERQEGGAESTSDQVGGVSADVATLVVGVDGQVQTEELDEVGVLAEAELVGEVERVVLVLLDSGDLAALEDVLVDAGGDGGELGDQVHRVLESVAPVLLLVDALGVGLGERRVALERSNGDGELGHRVQVAGAVVNQILDELGDLGTGSPVGGEVADLLLGGDLAGEEEPEET